MRPANILSRWVQPDPQAMEYAVVTVVPFTIVNFLVMMVFSSKPLVVLVAACLFVMGIFAVHKLRTGPTGFVVSHLNVALFAVSTAVSGPAAPGWILFIPPLVPAVFMTRKTSLKIYFFIFITSAALISSYLSGKSVDTLTGIGLTLAAISAFLFRTYFYMEQQNDLIQAERERSDFLLNAILPEQISHRMKNGEQMIADHLDAVSVLFADIVGFTRFSETRSPSELVFILNQIFTRFDRLISQFQLEKIKTIGDAYMVAGGLTPDDNDHAHRIADLALAMQAELEAFNQSTGHSFQLRTGIHIGQGVAGVIGETKFSYDIWGDTINTASRMESHGLPGRIHVSEQFAQTIQTTHLTETRGTIDIKGKEPMPTCWLIGRR